MNGLRVALRWAAGLCGLLLGIGGFYGGYQKLLSYKYARFIDVLPRFTFVEEVGDWSAVVALLFGAFFLFKFTLKSSGRENLGKAHRSLLP
jgi:hypothetical protein